MRNTEKRNIKDSHMVVTDSPHGKLKWYFYLFDGDKSRILDKNGNLETQWNQWVTGEKHF